MHSKKTIQLSNHQDFEGSIFIYTWFADVHYDADLSVKRMLLLFVLSPLCILIYKESFGQIITGVKVLKFFNVPRKTLLSRRVVQGSVSMSSCTCIVE